jgi:hypothetical protein
VGIDSLVLPSNWVIPFFQSLISFHSLKGAMGWLQGQKTAWLNCLFWIIPTTIQQGTLPFQVEDTRITDKYLMQIY